MKLNKLDKIVILSSFFVFLLLAIIFSILLYLVGGRLIFAILFSFLMIFVQWLIGPFVVKIVTGAREVSEKEYPLLHKMVEEISKEAGIKKPKVCIVENETPNAFAFGRTQGSSYVAVHTGLLKVLNEEEIKSVIAHEIGHIKHRDVIVITLASVLPTILYWAVYLILSGRGRDREGNFFAAWVGALLAQFFGNLAVLWLSREREYFADSFSKNYMKDPVPLARALVKITYNIKEEASPSMRAFYISEKQKIPNSIAYSISGGRKEIMEALKNAKEEIDIFSTHPCLVKRIKALFS